MRDYRKYTDYPYEQNYQGIYRMPPAGPGYIPPVPQYLMTDDMYAQSMQRVPVQPQAAPGTMSEYMPYYQAYNYPDAFVQEQENERDMERLKEMYPEMAKEVLKYVEDECDRMEYEGSIMFDERPDQVMVARIRDNIYDQVKGKFQVEEVEDKDEVFVMNQETRRRYPPRKNWLNDVIEIMLFQEMFRRRCRHRNCRRWY